jgi:3-oxoacyl-[acyl-carrier protein] reductase
MIETGLPDRVVVVTGGAAGIGRAVARRAAEIDAERFDARRVDVTDAAAVDAAAAAVVERWGRIDVLVNNAGIVRDKQLVKWKDGAVASLLDDATFDSVIAVNLKGVFLCARAVVPHMIRGGGGVILNASSVVGLYGNFGQTNYAATKAAVVNMTKTWARELGKHRIRVNAVAPGFIATEILQAMPPKVLDEMVSHTPLARMGTVEEIAEAYLWLASDAASFVNGTVLSVDGGLVPGT